MRANSGLRGAAHCRGLLAGTAAKDLIYFLVHLSVLPTEFVLGKNLREKRVP